MVDLLADPRVVDLAGDLFRPRPGRIQRVTFAWLDRGSLQGIPCPDERASTVIVAWACDARGRFLPDHVDESQVLEWRMTRHELAALRRWVTTWPLDRHDFSIAAGTVTPCWVTLRDADFWKNYKARIDRAIARLQVS